MLVAAVKLVRVEQHSRNEMKKSVSTRVIINNYYNYASKYKISGN